MGELICWAVFLGFAVAEGILDPKDETALRTLVVVGRAIAGILALVSTFYKIFHGGTPGLNLFKGYEKKIQRAIDDDKVRSGPGSQYD